MSEQGPSATTPSASNGLAPAAPLEGSPTLAGEMQRETTAPVAWWRWQRSAELALYLVLILALWAGAALWKLGAAPFYSKGEPREGLVVWEMTHGGGWVLPRRNGTELPSKPPLFHWLGALTSLAAGEVTEATLRFPSAILSLFGVLMVFAAGSLWWSARVGWYASLVLLSCFEWARAATNARVDMTLTVGLEAAFLSLVAYWRSGRPAWLIPLYAGMAWATLGKGPVGIALPALVAAAYFLLSFDPLAWRERRWREVLPWARLGHMRPVRGLAVVLLVTGVWYGLALWQGGYAFFRKQILAENVFTFLDDPEFGGGHRHGLLYLPGQLLLGFLPWSLLLPVIGAALWRERKELGSNDLRVLLLTWVLVVFAFYEAAASKRGVYLLALYPGLALLAAYAWHRWDEAAGEFARYARAIRVVAHCAATLSVIVGLVVASVQLGLPVQRLLEWLGTRHADAWVAARTLQALPFVQTAATLLAFAIPLWLAGRWLRARQIRRGLLAIFAGVWAATVGVRTVILPAYAEQVTLRDFMRAVRNHAGTSPVYFYGTFDYQAAYYSFGRLPVHEGEIDNDGPRFLLVARALWEGEGEQWVSAYRVVPLEPGDEPAVRPLVLLERRSSSAVESE